MTQQDIGADGTVDEDYCQFSNFYKQSIGLDSEENDSLLTNTVDRIDFPRLNHNNVDSFQYYTVDKFNNIQSGTGQLAIININIRGISCNFDNFLGYLGTINCNFDVIVLTECHIQKDTVSPTNLHNKYPIEGYDMFYIDSNIKFGGVILYIKTKFKATYCHDLTNSSNTHDSVYVKCNNPNSYNLHKKKQLYIGGYYRHCVSKSDDIMQFLNKLDVDISNKQLHKNDVIIAGDFNICLMKSTYNNDSLYFLNTIIGNNYEPLIFKPTRIQHHKNSLQVKSATLIDQIMTNLFSFECTAGNLDYSSSDHHATFTIFHNYLDNDKNCNDKYLRRHIHKIDKASLLEDFGSQDWDTLVYNKQNLIILQLKMKDLAPHYG